MDSELIRQFNVQFFFILGSIKAWYCTITRAQLEHQQPTKIWIDLHSCKVEGPIKLSSK